MGEDINKKKADFVGNSLLLLHWKNQKVITCINNEWVRKEQLREISVAALFAKYRECLTWCAGS
jgi:hypothetical protein